jgi:MerR HTH family regulatory protein
VSTATEATFPSEETARLAGISYRQLDYWCREGALGPELQRPLGSGRRRRFTAQDLTALRAVRRASEAFAELMGREGRYGSVALYREIVAQVRAGAGDIRFRLADQVELSIDISDLAPSRPAAAGTTPTQRPGDHR